MRAGLRFLACKPENSRPESGEDLLSHRNGNRHSNKLKVRRKSNEMNTPGRESFSERAFPTWFVVARKRLPTTRTNFLENAANTVKHGKNKGFRHSAKMPE